MLRPKILFDISDVSKSLPCIKSEMVVPSVSLRAVIVALSATTRTDSVFLVSGTTVSSVAGGIGGLLGSGGEAKAVSLLRSSRLKQPF